MFYFSNYTILAIGLPLFSNNFRFQLCWNRNPLLLQISTIAFLFAVALSFSLESKVVATFVPTITDLVNVDYVQSIGSGIEIFSQLFYDVQCYNAGSIIIEPPLEPMAIILSSAVPVKTKRLTKNEREEFVIPKNLQEILVGLLLGDLCSSKQKANVNARLLFEQGKVHEEYLMHLYELFSSYCGTAPKITNRLPDKRTGKTYTRVKFQTYALPCFNILHNLFYPEGTKIVPTNIADLVTPLSLAYWICDDGTWGGNSTRLCTNSYTLAEVNLLVKVLTDKFGLKCTIIEKYSGSGVYLIRISTKAVPDLQKLLLPIIPAMMRYKICGKS
jgi:hypothetical protein